MRSCRYGIHDISRTELDRNKLPRFNMPFELGVFFGAKRFGAPSQRHKRLLILDTKQYRYQKFISDLAGMDIHAHNGSHERAMGETRDWLATVARRQLLSRRHLIRLHRRFRHDLPALADELGLDVAKLAYVDFERFVAGWLFEAAS